LTKHYADRRYYFAGLAAQLVNFTMMKREPADEAHCLGRRVAPRVGADGIAAALRAAN
jgi:hypothetical protein